MEILVILKKINGSNHDFEAHMHGKIEKPGEGSRDVNILYKISWLIQRLCALCKCLTIHEELRCKIWPHSFYWPSEEFEQFGSRRWGQRFQEWPIFMFEIFINILRFRMNQWLKICTLTVITLLKRIDCPDYYFGPTKV